MAGLLDVVMVRGNIQHEVEKLQKARVGGVQKALRKALTNSTKPLRRSIRDAARERLPKGGGLNKWAGVMPGLVSEFKTGEQRVIIRDTKRGHDLKSIDRGRLRHPLWGNRNYWYGQQIAPGFFSDTIEAGAPALKAIVEGEMSAYLDSIGKG